MCNDISLRYDTNGKEKLFVIEKKVKKMKADIIRKDVRILVWNHGRLWTESVKEEGRVVAEMQNKQKYSQKIIFLYLIIFRSHRQRAFG